MARVFLSYDHEDRARAAPIAAALESAGHSVWWDQRIAAGSEYNREIEQAVAGADAVVVLWSRRSVESPWVRDEAAAGRDGGKLVPASIDGASPPMGFRQYQTIDLSRQRTKGSPERFQSLTQAIEQLTPTKGGARGTPERRPEGKRRLGAKLPILIVAMLLVAAAGAVAWRWMQPSSSVPLVVVAPSSTSTDAALAQSLLVKLGSLRSAKTDSVRLIGGTSGAAPQADFVFEAAAGKDQNAGQGSLALLTGKDRSVLWSKDFEIKGGSRAALEQSMAYTAGQVLDCALQASAPSGGRLDEQTLKLFLNGCALFGDRYRSDPNSVVPIFTHVVGRAPRFEPAWAKLLLAEAQNTRGQMLFYDRWAPGRLPEHIRTASKLNPHMPELYLARIALLPLGALDQRLKLVDEAIERNPDHPDLLVSRTELLSTVGRNSDAVEDARRAAELNPLSAGFRSNLIQMLTYAGELAAAEEDLRRAELLWPGSSTIEDARFRFASRYGDASEAMRMLQSPDFRQYYSTQEMTLYLRARLDPTEENIRAAIAASQSPQLSKTRGQIQLIQLLADFGRNDAIYERLMAMSPEQGRLVSAVLFRPAFAEFRKHPRTMRFAARAGLVDFWRRTGQWPDFCFEPDLPYDCKNEAAKLK